MVESSKTYIGIVEDNLDPLKLGRLKIRVLGFYNKIKVEDIPWATPWKDLNGNVFNLPEVGKILTVIFDSGDIYKPEYIYADNFNINLENKLKSLSEDDYITMKSLFFDHSTQIWRNRSTGLKIDHEYSNINLDNSGNILFNLRDNKSVITVGSKDADEEAMLGTTFMSWFEDFMEILIGVNGPSSVGADGNPITPLPNLIDVYTRFLGIKKDFLSKHIRLSGNDKIIPQERDYIDQSGDNWNSNEIENNRTLNIPTGYNPESKIWDNWDNKEVDYKSPYNIENPNGFNPNEYRESVAYDIPTSSLDKSKFENGKILSEYRKESLWLSGKKKSKWISTNIGGEKPFLSKEASEAFDRLFDLFDSTDFKGKAPIIFSDGYRSYDDQVRLYNQYGSGWAAKPGTSNHGWGLAVDISGISSPFDQIKKNPIDRKSAFRTPNYQWLFENSWKFGIYNPNSLRDGQSVDEYWHWEFLGDKGEPKILFPDYHTPFTKGDLITLKRNGVTSPSEKFLNNYFDNLS
jgi:hypothetical protein